jgi:Flp pilus assembly protein protease CpaA
MAAENWVYLSKVVWLLCTVLLCAFMTVRDLKKRIIENVFCALLGALGLIGFAYSQNYYEMIIAGSMFAILAVFGIVAFYALGDDKFGGGDVKMLAASSLFMTGLMPSVYYAFSMLVISLAVFIFCKIAKIKSFPAAVIYSFAVITASGLKYFEWYGLFFTLAFAAIVSYKIFKMAKAKEISIEMLRQTEETEQNSVPAADDAKVKGEDKK